MVSAQLTRNATNVHGDLGAGVLLAFVVMFGGAASPWGFWGAAIGALILLAAAVVSMLHVRIVVPVGIDQRHVRVKGCGEDYLQTFPDLPR